MMNLSVYWGRWASFGTRLAPSELEFSPVNTTKEDTMEIFTPAQITILERAFDHVWARMESLHDDLNQEGVRLAALLKVLNEQKVITLESWHATMRELEMHARENRPPAKDTDRTEQQITREILQGRPWKVGLASEHPEGL
jgi:hypothetical protein